MKEIKAKDFRTVLKDYPNKWVALSRDGKKVLASGNSLDAVTKRLPKTQRLEKPTFLRVLPEHVSYSPSTL